MERTTELDELRSWLEEGYATSYRTACLILGNAADAEEAVQEAFLRAWRFRASLSSGSDVRRWLYRVVVNTCNSKLRTEIPHRDRRAPDAELLQLARSIDTADAVSTSIDLTAALSDLPVHLRIVVVLRYYADLSEREIATAIGRPAGTVKSRLHEARRLLAAHPSVAREAMASPTPDTGAAR